MIAPHPFLLRARQEDAAARAAACVEARLAHERLAAALRRAVGLPGQRVR